MYISYGLLPYMSISLKIKLSLIIPSDENIFDSQGMKNYDTYMKLLIILYNFKLKQLTFR